MLVLDNLRSGHRSNVPENLLHEGDIGDVEFVRSLIRRHGVTSVMHFAARSLVGESVEDPLAYVEGNVGRTARLLQAMQAEGVHEIVFSSSAAVYGEPREIPIPEDHPKQPLSPYGQSKWWIEETLRACGSAWGLGSISLRYFNAAGGVPELGLRERHDPETHLIPRLLETHRAGGVAEIFGGDYPTPDGTAIRDYVHVLDLAEAHVLALGAVRAGHNGAYNVGTGLGLSVREVVDAVGHVTGRPLMSEMRPRRSGDPAVLVADPGRIMSELGWAPRHSGIEEIVETAL